MDGVLSFRIYSKMKPSYKPKLFATPKLPIGSLHIDLLFNRYFATPIIINVSNLLTFRSLQTGSWTDHVIKTVGIKGS